MIFNLVKNETDLGELHKLTESFFGQLDSVTSFDEIVFPAWYKVVFERTKLNNKFKDIFNVYKTLSHENQRAVIVSLRDTNRVCDLCKNDIELKVACLEDLPKSIQQPIYELSFHLWKNALSFERFRSHFSTDLNSYIEAFIKANDRIEVCPFCALEDFTELSGQSRIEIDHWLCRKKYPHLIVNFDNLVPIGHFCNSDPVKGDKDVLEKLNKNQRAYYPYCQHNGISVIFNFINEPVLTNDIKKEDWELIIRPNNLEDEDLVESWKDIFNIQERYESVITKYVFKTWENKYYRWGSKYIKGFMEPIDNIEFFKSNLRQFKEDFYLREQAMTLMYWAFLDYLIERASEKYLEGLCCNFERLAKSEKKPKESY